MESYSRHTGSFSCEYTPPYLHPFTRLPSPEHVGPIYHLSSVPAPEPDGLRDRSPRGQEVLWYVTADYDLEREEVEETIVYARAA